MGIVPSRSAAAGGSLLRAPSRTWLYFGDDFAGPLGHRSHCIERALLGATRGATRIVG